MGSASENSMLEGAKIDELGTKEQADLLNAIDELRWLGIGDHIGLPQLIVCGDQSSGKSSVLEAITNLRFPTGDDVCTVFATELTLRRAISSQVNVSIRPGPTRSESESKQLSKFNESLATPENFPDIIDAAKKLMRETSRANGERFFDDVLRIEVSGPDYVQFTIVDLPGLIHVQGGGQSNNVEVVKQLVESYMENKRSIILAVISANANKSLQQVFDLMAKYDPNYIRTLGIITKPDMLHDHSKDQENYIALARNQGTPLKHRWHVLRNRDFPSRDSTAKERDDVERNFFSNGIWKTLDRDDVGVDSLRSKLSTVLLQQIRCELPFLIDEIQSQMYECKAQIDRLGKPRGDVSQQRLYLSRICEAYQRITNLGIWGLYEGDSFFDESSLDGESHKYLRATLQFLNEQFSDVMVNKGHIWQASDQVPQNAGSGKPNPIDEVIDSPSTITEEEFINLARNIVRRKRRDEPIGMLHPYYVGALLRIQTQRWREIAEKHLRRVWKAVKVFLESVVRYVADTTTSPRLMLEKIDPTLDGKLQELMTKLEELLFPTLGHPLTYDPDYISKMLPRLSTESSTTPSHGISAYTDLWMVMQEHYKVARSHFIDNIACLAIEQNLISRLPKILSAESVLEMDDETVRLLASESEQVIRKRDMLQQKLNVLRSGLDTIRRQASLEPEAMRILHNPSPRQGKVSSSATGTHASSLPTTSTRSSSPSSSPSSNTNSINSGTPITPPSSTARSAVVRQHLFDNSPLGAKHGPASKSIQFGHSLLNRHGDTEEL